MKSASYHHQFFPAIKVRQGAGFWLIVTLLLMVGFAAFSGVAIAYAGLMGAVAAIAVVMGLISVTVPVRHLVVLLVVTAYVIMGQLIYFAGVNKAFWLPLLLGLVLLVRLPAELMRRNPADALQSPFQPQQSAGIRVTIVVFFCALTATTLINLNPPLQIFVSAKEYVFLWGLYLTITAGLIQPDLMEKLWRFLPWLLPLQVPIVLYQRFVVAARRTAAKSAASWDAVVGAFGGDPDGGGMSGAMGIFVVICITLSVIRWRKGLLRPLHCALIVGSGLIAILLAEVKFAVLMLPIAIAVAYLREFVRRPLTAIGMSLVAGCLAVGLLSAYELQYWSTYQQKNVGNYAENVFAASADPDFINMDTGEIGRVAALTFWASAQTNAVEVLIGHGVGSSRKGGTVVGEQAARWPFAIARSSLAILLWEAGVIGAAAFMSLFVFGCARAYKLSNHASLSEGERAVLMTCGAIFALLLLEMPYNTDAFYSPQIQILMMLALAQLALSAGRIAAATRSQPRSDR